MLKRLRTPQSRLTLTAVARKEFEAFMAHEFEEALSHASGSKREKQKTAGLCNARVVQHVAVIKPADDSCLLVPMPALSFVRPSTSDSRPFAEREVRQRDSSIIFKHLQTTSTNLIYNLTNYQSKSRVAFAGCAMHLLAVLCIADQHMADQLMYRYMHFGRALVLCVCTDLVTFCNEQKSSSLHVCRTHLFLDSLDFRFGGKIMKNQSVPRLMSEGAFQSNWGLYHQHTPFLWLQRSSISLVLFLINIAWYVYV